MPPTLRKKNKKNSRTLFHNQFLTQVSNLKCFYWGLTFTNLYSFLLPVALIFLSIFRYRLAYPYFLHPAKGMIRTSTIYMVVAISAERYKAICYPLR